MVGVSSLATALSALAALLLCTYPSCFALCSTVMDSGMSVTSTLSSAATIPSGGEAAVPAEHSRPEQKIHLDGSTASGLVAERSGSIVPTDSRQLNYRI